MKEIEQQSEVGGVVFKYNKNKPADKPNLDKKPENLDKIDIGNKQEEKLNPYNNVQVVQ